MPAYSFEALDPGGLTRTGVLEALSARAARTALRNQSLIPLHVAAVGANAVHATPLPRLNNWFRPKPLSAAKLPTWTRQLASLLAAGLTIERALTALLEEADSDEERNLVAALRAEVNAGSSFGGTLAQHMSFPRTYVSVVAAGEQSGRLASVMTAMADDVEEQQNLETKLLSAILYPAIVTVIAIGIVAFLLAYVVPQIAAVYSGTARTLPILTTTMLAISGAFQHYGWFALAGVTAAALGARLLLRNEEWRTRFDSAWLDLPVVGRLARGSNGARFAGTLGILTGAGLPILKALQLAAETIGNRAMRADAMDALMLVREGAPLGTALHQKRRFPSLIAMFARLGEQTGELPRMLQAAARQLSGDVQRRALRLATVLEPVLIVAMGVIVLLIVLAVLLPIIQLNQWVR